MEKPRNKATMDAPQEEFIAPESSHAGDDRGHGHEVETAWAREQRAAAGSPETTRRP